MSFKEKFVKYLTEGIPVHINKDEVHLFYKSLKDFVNDADNNFMAFYLDGDDEVVISDLTKDYLRVNYENDKIVFRQPALGDIKESTTSIFATGQAFLGVLIFIESIAPSEDSSFISEKYNDQWKF